MVMSGTQAQQVRIPVCAGDVEELQGVQLLHLLPIVHQELWLCIVGHHVLRRAGD